MTEIEITFGLHMPTTLGVVTSTLNDQARDECGKLPGHRPTASFTSTVVSRSCMHGLGHNPVYLTAARSVGVG